MAASAGPDKDPRCGKCVRGGLRAERSADPVDWNHGGGAVHFGPRWKFSERILVACAREERRVLFVAVRESAPIFKKICSDNDLRAFRADILSKFVPNVVDTRCVAP